MSRRARFRPMASRSGGTRGRGSTVEILNPWGYDADLLGSIADGFTADDRASVESVPADNVSLEAKRRILTADPPDLWAGWVGPDLQPYYEADVLGDVTTVWTESDMERQFVDAAREAVRFGDAYRGVPLNVQRTNLLVCNVAQCEQAGVDPTGIADPRAFCEALEQLDDAVDGPPLIVGFIQPFASQGLYMWEGIYLGLHGRRAYRDLVEGRAGRRRSEAEEALALFDRILGLANDDALHVTEAAEDERFANGDGAVRMQGMWAGLNLASADLDYGTDWEFAPQPGTDGLHVINMDGLAMPSNGPSPDATARFLAHAGSPAGIDAFNRVKKSIPPRTDVSLDGYPPFVREQAEDFRRADDHLPSMAHGFAVPPEALIDLEVAFADFLDSRDAAATARELVDVFDRDG